MFFFLSVRNTILVKISASNSIKYAIPMTREKHNRGRVVAGKGEERGNVEPRNRKKNDFFEKRNSFFLFLVNKISLSLSLTAAVGGFEPLSLFSPRLQLKTMAF